MVKVLLMILGGKRTSAEELNYGFGHDPITPLEKNDLDKIAQKSKHNLKRNIPS